MVYQGSKERLKGDILPYIQECIDDNGIELYVEPFVGGANVIDSVRCAVRYGCDKSDYLISLLRYMRDNPAMEAAPHDCPVNLYRDVRGEYNARSFKYSKPYTAMVGYFASYGGRFFDGGYGRDPSGKRNIYKERLKKARSQAPFLKGIRFCKQDWEETLASRKLERSRAFVYLDPPYRGTKEYAVKGGFDYGAYYARLIGLKDRAFILCSEYDMPEGDFVRIWSKERKVLQKSDRKEGEVSTECLYTPYGGLYYKWWEARKCLSKGNSTSAER